MAAYAALVSLMNDLELIPNHPTHSFSFDNHQITSLSQTVHFLIDFMETYDPHGCTREAAATMERRIASAAHAAHDVVETHVVDQLLSGTTLDGKSRSCFMLYLQREIDNMDFVKSEAIRFKEKSGLKVATYPSPAFKEKSGLKVATYSSPASSEPLSSEKNVTVGFDAVVVRLLEMLTGEPSGHRVIPVVGMGGIGKTTLARNVYEHSLIQHHFDVCLWATISQKYSAENILKGLLPKNSRNASELGVELHKMLWGRRYLIVLDDMWSVEAWDEIQRFLPDNANGSCVIVTTRLSDLAARLSSDRFEMDFLDDDQSWELFCGKTFGEGDCPSELEEIGKKIVKRCRGLPLSIVVIGGHLKRALREIEYWETVANLINLISGLGADDQCLEVISLSYEHLPTWLKPCFLYLGIFEEDNFIDAPKLLRLWIAEGFVKGKEGVSLEEVAEDYLKDLFDRNLILDPERKWNGKIKKFVIHDIVRELCLKVAQQEKFLGVLDATNVRGIVGEHRIVVPRELSSSQPHIIMAALQSPPSQLLRSLICQELRFIDQLPVDLILLRVFAHVDSVIVLKSVVKNQRFFQPANFPHVNLRYQDWYVNSRYLPSSLSLFWNIQTLVVKNKISTPFEIWEMTQLRHLEFEENQLLVDPLPGVMNEHSDEEKCVVLENLHTLLGVENLRFTEEVCKRMPNIKNLSLYYTDLLGDERKASSSSYYCPHNLGLLNKLESLKCHFGDDYSWSDVQNFELPSSLEELSLWNCYWKDLTIMIKPLSSLGFLWLIELEGPEWNLADEELEFPCLKILKIINCANLIRWNADSSHFPVLEILDIWRSPMLSEIPFDIGEIPTLRRIQMLHCSVSAAVSAMRIVVEQESLGNEDLIVDVDLWEMEEVERFQTIVKEECLMTDSLRLCHRFKKIKAF